MNGKNRKFLCVGGCSDEGSVSSAVCEDFRIIFLLRRARKKKSERGAAAVLSSFLLIKVEGLVLSCQSVTIKSAADFDNWTGLSAVSHLLAIVDWNFNNKLADICGASVNFLAELKAPADSLICALERCIYPIWSFGRILLPKLCVWRENSQLIRRKLYWNFFIFPPKPEISRFH